MASGFLRWANCCVKFTPMELPKDAKMTKLRSFLRFSWAFRAGLLSIVLAGCGEIDEQKAGEHLKDNTRNFRWKLVTAWPPNTPINHETVVQFAEDVRTMSSGRLDIQVFAGGELIPALQSFDAVSQGSVQMAHAASYFWAGKIPAAQFMTAVPFGMTREKVVAWLYGSDGLELWRELYEPFGIIPFPMGNTGIQMGGWFNKKIETISDLQGLKMRIPGLGGKVLAKAGGNPVLLAPGEIYTALERGTIDATEWVGPLLDVRFGLNRAAKYYYYPGWHEPGSQLELLVNANAWAELGPDLQAILEAAAALSASRMNALTDAENARVLNELYAKGQTEILKFPEEVMEVLEGLTDDVLAEESEGDPVFARVLKSYQSFRSQMSHYAGVTTEAYKESFSYPEE